MFIMPALAYVYHFNKRRCQEGKITLFQNKIYISNADLIRSQLSLKSSVCSVFLLFHFFKDGKQDENE